MSNYRKKTFEKKTKPIVNQNINNNILKEEKNKIGFLPYIIFCIFGIILYANSLTNDFALDDAIVITKNKFTQKGVAGIGEIFKYDTFTGFWLTSEKDKTAEQIQREKKLVVGGRYRPLSLATFAIERSIFGKEIYEEWEGITYYGNPFVSHLINLILYLLTTCLLFKILSTFFPLRTGQKWYLSLPFIASLLFLAHPIHTEAIANIKGRDEIMTLLGSLGALWFSIKYCTNKKSYNLILSGICLFLGLLSKENAITFLAVIPITLYYFIKIEKNKFKTILLTLIPLAVSALFFLLIRANVLGFVHTQDTAKEIMNNPFLNATFSEKYATIFYTLLIYIKLLIIPHPLTYDYYPKQIEIINFTNPKAFLSLFIYLCLGIYALYGLLKKKKQESVKIITWSIWLFLLPLSVVSNLFFPVGTFMNERFIFISSIGFCVVIAFLFSLVLPKIIKNIKIVNTFSIIFLLPVLSLFTFKTINRNFAWKNDFTLFTTDVKISTESAKSNCSAGGKLLERAKLEKDRQLKETMFLQSIKYLQKAISIHPTYIDAINLLGNAYYEHNYNISKALDCYLDVLKLNPRHAICYENIKIVVGQTNGFLSEKKTQSTAQEILTSCNNILKQFPEFGEVLYLKAVIYGKYLNNIESSIAVFEETEKLPNFNKTINYYKDIGVAYGISRQYEKALFYFLKVLAEDANDPQTYFNLSATYQNLGDIENANKYLQIGKSKQEELLKK